MLDGSLEDDGEDEGGDQGGDGAEDGVAAALWLGLQSQHEHHHQDCYDTNQQSQDSSEQNPELTTIMLLPQVLPLCWVQTLVPPQSWSRDRSRARPASGLEVEEM